MSRRTNLANEITMTCPLDGGGSDCPVLSGFPTSDVSCQQEFKGAVLRLLLLHADSDLSKIPQQPPWR
eukprot:scaffold8058_cov158-Amphora_coffeaeformis.AAC.5